MFDKRSDDDEPGPDPEEELDKLEKDSADVNSDIDAARGKWEDRKADSTIPGALDRGSIDGNAPGVDEPWRPVAGSGYAVGHLDGLGDGPGFRKVRQELDVAELGVNAIVIPPGHATRFHFHDDQEELYFIHRGVAEIEFGDGSRFKMGAGAFARVDARTPRQLHNVGEEDLIYICVGAKGGYVGRDGHEYDPENPPG